MKEITSKDNAKIKEITSLLTSSKKRRNSGLFLVEGVRLCLDAALSGLAPVDVFVTKTFTLSHSHELKKLQKEAIIVTEDIMRRISDTVSPQGIVCTFPLKERELRVSAGGKYVVLENISDPSNLGAISRTAEALGIDGLVVSDGCDIYNPKALRASMGALFRLPVALMSSAAAIELFGDNGVITYAAVPDSAAVDVRECDWQKGSALFIGNEANGLSDEIINKCGKTVTIPMSGEGESLNAAAASAIFIYEMTRTGGEKFEK